MREELTRAGGCACRICTRLFSSGIIMPEQNGPRDPERTDVIGETYSGDRLLLDGKHFENCSSDT